MNEEEEPVNVISINLNDFNEISMLNTSPSSGNLSKPDNFLLLGDFNSEMNDNAMREFSDTHNLKDLITNPTCFKTPFKT